MKYVKVAVPDGFAGEKLRYIDGTLLDVWRPERRDVLDHGFVALVDFMGDDQAIDDAARTSYAEGTRKVNELRGLIRYLMRHLHTTPFEMVETKWIVKMPIFVARQWQRHRTASINEQSMRYSLAEDEFYCPELDALKPQSPTNRQGRAGELSDNDRLACQQAISEVFQVAYEAYEYLTAGSTMPPTNVQKFRLSLEGEIWKRARELRSAGDGVGMSDDDVQKAIDAIGWKVLSDDFPKEGLARELSRIVLPVSAYTTIVWKTNLHNLMHFLQLRMDPHAQYEIRVYAEQMFDMVKPLFPLAMEAFEDYRLKGSRLSRMELELLRAMLSAGRHKSFNELTEESGLKDRELAEFRAKFP